MLSNPKCCRKKTLALGAVRTGQLRREQCTHQCAEEPDPLHAMAASLDRRTTCFGMLQSLNAPLDRVAMLLRHHPLHQEHIATPGPSSVQSCGGAWRMPIRGKNN
ncbi:hypothetical protein UPYG_G00044980 [Umbra pygmaea]|uniref:Uncharacterized protein n=1 Tax=Umbra pygmaea TaxID=75934 RepID=A0ABD0XQT6_UMBPY